jgi:signal transduction histidine kinase
VVGAGPRTWSVVVWVVTGILFVIGWSTLHLTHDVPSGLGPVIAGIGVLPLLLVRRQPFLAWAVWAAGGTGIPLFFGLVGTDQFPWQVTAFLVLLALVLTVAVRESLRRVAVTWVGTGALFLLFMPGEIAPGWIFGLTAIMGVGLLLRRLAASRRELAEETERGELERARRAVVEERTRIARDLHDVVAHRMSMVVVQAQSAQYRLGGVEPAVAAEFSSVAEQAREALNEVRAMLGVLRSDGQLPDQVPQPGTADVERLLREAEGAGLDLRWSVTGDPDVCSEATAMVLYRILQESLANASRHAHDSTVTVHLAYAEEIRLVVANGPGSRPAASDGHTGHGLPGMRDRAAAVGGRVTAAPTDDGGFTVVAELPARVAG